MKHKTPPSKDEVKLARSQMRSARKVLRAAMKPRVRRFVRTHHAHRDFYTWMHDFHTMLESAARESDLPADEMVNRAMLAADRMSYIISERKPAVEEHRSMYSRRVVRRRNNGELRRWREWQSTFDSLLHVLCSKTKLTVDEVLSRAETLADMAQKVVDKRRPERA
jgi:hypothetical protein